MRYINTLMSTDKFLLETFQTFFNNPNFADVVLVFNDKNYYLLESLVKHYAPRLFEEFERAPTSVPMIQNDTSSETIIANLSQLLNHARHKKTVTMYNISISDEIVGNVLSVLYGKTIKIDADNLKSVYLISDKFGIKHLLELCTAFFRSTVYLSTLVSDYFDMWKTAPMMKPLWFRTIVENLDMFSDKRNELVATLNHEDMMEILGDNELKVTEDFLYDLADKWCLINNLNCDHCKILMSKIQLDRLSIDVLVNNAGNNNLVDRNMYIKVIEKRLLRVSSLNNNSGYRGIEFAVGKLRESYNGFRLPTPDEIKTEKFKKMFTKNYIANNGIISLDNFVADIICCLGYSISIKEFGYLRFYDSQLSTGKIAAIPKIGDSAESTSNVLITMYTHSNAYHCSDNTGLFVSNDITF